jgi:hypothetical protein
MYVSYRYESRAVVRVDPTITHFRREPRCAIAIRRVNGRRGEGRKGRIGIDTECATGTEPQDTYRSEGYYDNQGKPHRLTC